MTHDYEDGDDEEDLGALFLESGNVRDDPPQMGHNSQEEPDEALDNLDMEDLLKEGRKMLLKDLVKAVKQGYASPQEKNTLRQMLKDNGMIMGDPLNDPTTPSRRRDLPEFPRPDYDNT